MATLTHSGRLINITDERISDLFKIITNNEYVYAIVDNAEHIVLGLKTDGSLVNGNIVISNISNVNGNSLVDDNFANGLKTVQNDIYSFAVVDKNDYVIFGVKTNGEVVCKNITDKIGEIDLSSYATISYVNEQITSEEDRAKTAEENLQTQIDNIDPTVVIGGDNNPDEVFLTSLNDTLTFKNIDKSLYNMNLVYVRDFSTDLTKTNTIYVINFEHNLNNSTVTIPDNSILYFMGGLVYNGILSGSNTKVISNGPCFNNISFSGTWNISKISTNMFVDKASVNCLKKINSLLSDDYYNEVYIESGDYTFTPNVSSDAFIVLKSNTKLIVDGTINVTPNGFHHYYVVNMANKTNIEICGKGRIVGDADEHDYTTITSTHEWCHAIHTTNTDNVSIHDLVLMNMPGDGAEVDGDNYQIYNMKISHCGRQGISVLSCENVNIHDCIISDIYRIAPMAAIDVEPYTENYARNVKISNIKCDNCYGIMVLYADEVIVENISATNCYKVLEGNDARNVVFNNIDYSSSSPFSEIILVNFTNSENIVIQNSKFKPNSTTNFSLTNIKLLFGNNFDSVTFTNTPEEGSVKYENHQYYYWNGTTWAGM